MQPNEDRVLANLKIYRPIMVGSWMINVEELGIVIYCPSRTVGHKIYEVNRYLHPFAMIWFGAALRNSSNSRAMAWKGRQSPKQKHPL
jgi:hypothetical protein